MKPKESIRHRTVSQLLDERFINEELKQHMGNLFSLSDGMIGKEYKPDIKINLMSGKIEGPAIRCKKCGIELDEEEPQQNDMCIDCFAEEWGELIEKFPITCPRIEGPK